MIECLSHLECHTASVHATHTSAHGQPTRGARVCQQQQYYPRPSVYMYFLLFIKKMYIAASLTAVWVCHLYFFVL